MATFEVGQTVVLKTWNSETEVPVVRVGRKLVYVLQYNRERSFLMDGVEHNHKYGSADRIYSLEDWANKVRLQTAANRLSELGIRLEYTFPFRNDVGVLESLIAVVDTASSK